MRRHHSLGYGSRPWWNAPARLREVPILQQSGITALGIFPMPFSALQRWTEGC